MGAEESQHDQIMAQTFNESRINYVEISPQEARKMVLKTNILLIPRMYLKRMFLLDQVWNQEDLMLMVEFDSEGGMKGTWYNPRIETLAFWAK